MINQYNVDKCKLQNILILCDIKKLKIRGRKLVYVDVYIHVHKDEREWVEVSSPNITQQTGHVFSPVIHQFT